MVDFNYLLFSFYIAFTWAIMYFVAQKALYQQSVLFFQCFVFAWQACHFLLVAF